MDVSQTLFMGSISLKMTVIVILIDLDALFGFFFVDHRSSKNSVRSVSVGQSVCTFVGRYLSLTVR